MNPVAHEQLMALTQIEAPTVDTNDREGHNNGAVEFAGQYEPAGQMMGIDVLAVQKKETGHGRDATNCVPRQVPAVQNWLLLFCATNGQYEPASHLTGI